MALIKTFTQASCLHCTVLYLSMASIVKLSHNVAKELLKGVGVP